LRGASYAGVDVMLMISRHALETLPYVYLF